MTSQLETQTKNRGVIVCKAALGNIRTMIRSDPSLDIIAIKPQHTVYGKEGLDLKYPEFVFYDEAQVLPIFLIRYQVQ